MFIYIHLNTSLSFLVILPVPLHVLHCSVGSVEPYPLLVEGIFMSSCYGSRFTERGRERERERDRDRDRH